MIKSFTALFVLVAALALDGTPAQAQINININRPAPQYVVVHEVHSEKKWKAPKQKKATVLLVPAQPVYVVRRGHGHGHGHGHGKGKH
ncbi:hypothetical protein [uncultured Hymenobacter sp.]|uniref:hypothetical protein n=1 Tax=uncultured Hymenobacter sp. TaxID=170016 RepID=UPI0035CA8F73